MDNTYDLTRLDREEKFELRALQKKERDVNGDLEKFTVDELRQYSELLRKLQGLPSAYAHIIDPIWPDGEHHTLKTPRHPKTTAYCHWCGALGAVTYTNSSVPGVYCSEQCLENMLTRHRTPSMNPPAIAPAAAPANPVAPATPTPAATRAEAHKPPADSVTSALHQLDGMMRFGYDLPEEPR